MNIWILKSLDYFFLIFHTLFTLFNVFGWIWKKTRKAHLITIALTAGSWFILGIWYGWGYCFCTEWHWQVRAALHHPITSYSYIHFLILEMTGIDIRPWLVDEVVLVVFLISTAMTLILNTRDFIKNREKNN